MLFQNRSDKCCRIFCRLEWLIQDIANILQLANIPLNLLLMISLIGTSFFDSQIQLRDIHFHADSRQVICVELHFQMVLSWIQHDKQFGKHINKLLLALWTWHFSHRSIIDFCFPFMTAAAFPPVFLLWQGRNLIWCNCSVLLAIPLYCYCRVGLWQAVQIFFYHSSSAVRASAAINSWWNPRAVLSSAG